MYYNCDPSLLLTMAKAAIFVASKIMKQKEMRALYCGLSSSLKKGKSNKNIFGSVERAFEIANKAFYRFFIPCLILEIFQLKDTSYPRHVGFSSPNILRIKQDMKKLEHALLAVSKTLSKEQRIFCCNYL